MKELAEKLYETHDLSDGELAALIETDDADTAEHLRRRADEVRRKYYGNRVFLRGLIEISSYCRNNCHYCGIRRGNASAERYRLSREEILRCCENGCELGFRTFVMQGGEDAFFTDDFLCSLIEEIKRRYPDCAVTLSLGERSYESYRRLKESGADRYLLRHEAADGELYSQLHPAEMSLENRKRCLYDLKSLGYQVGAGFMAGAPFQTTKHIISDLRFMQELSPQMIGIGPFIPHAATQFAREKSGSVELTIRLLGIIRLMFPKVLLPATTALATVSPDGRKRGLMTGCNVIMPNLSPVMVREKYSLYDNKLCSDAEAAECRDSLLRRQIGEAGCVIADERGDAVN